MSDANLFNRDGSVNQSAIHDMMAEQRAAAAARARMFVRANGEQVLLTVYPILYRRRGAARVLVTPPPVCT